MDEFDICGGEWEPFPCHFVVIKRIPSGLHNSRLGMPSEALKNVRDLVHEYMSQQSRRFQKLDSFDTVVEDLNQRTFTWHGTSQRTRQAMGFGVPQHADSHGALRTHPRTQISVPFQNDTGCLKDPVGNEFGLI
jgi:hypothetical protein